MKPLVSVLIPAYRAEKYLGETLDSVLGQTYPNIEVIVVDDGSPDATRDVAERYGGPSVTVLSQANAGAAAARNRALRNARGGFIQFLDADDVLHPRKIEVQVRRLLSEPRDTVATARWGRFYGDDPSEARFISAPDWRDYEAPIDWLIDAWSWRGTMPPGSWLVPQSVLRSAGRWREDLSLNDDGEFFTRVALHAGKIAFCSEAEWYYRSAAASLSGRRDEAALRSQFEATRSCTEHLLAAENSDRSRLACACLWQSFQYIAYPEMKHLVSEAQRRIDALGGGDLRPDVSPKIAPVRDLLGWKAALRLQRTVARLRAVAL